MTLHQTSQTLVGESGSLLVGSHQKILFNDQKNVDEVREKERDSVIEAVNFGRGSRALTDHEWVSELSSFMHEHVNFQKTNFDTDVPCVVQWPL